jgi:hypothetical protein
LPTALINAMPRRTADGPTTGPVWDRGQQEAGNCRHHEAEQHFMDLPGKRIKPARYHSACHQEDDPQRQRRGRPYASSEKK